MQVPSTHLAPYFVMRSPTDKASKTRDLFDVYELYAADYVPPTGQGFQPSSAVALFSGVSVVYNGLTYRREVVSRGSVNRFKGQEFSNVTISFSNISRYMANYVLTTKIEGMQLVVRTISLSYLTLLADSTVIFTGRIEKAAEIDRDSCSITAKQDLGSVEDEIPPRVIRTECPLEFKGAECLGNIPLTSHTAAYQAATTCNKSFESNCTEYGNTNFYQGFRYVAVTGTFQYQTTEVRRFLIFFKKKKKVTHTEQWSSENDTEQGRVLPFILGRCQVELFDIVHADIGEAIKFLKVAGEGKVSGIVDIRNQTTGFSAPNNVTVHLGDWGGSGTNATGDPQFPEQGVFSRTAYIGGAVTGSKPDIVDPSPLVTAVVLGQEVPLRPSYNTVGFSDNNAELTRFVLTERRLLNIPPERINDAVCTETAELCDEPLIDDSNGERLFLTQEDYNLLSGGQFSRYHSTGILNPTWFRWKLDVLYSDPYLTLPDIDIFDIFLPPALIAPVRYLRRRYTANVPITSKVKSVDFLFNTLLPSFKGYLLTGPDGRIQIRTERPADSTNISTSSVVGATQIAIRNIEPWRASRQGLALIGVSLTTSETRAVTSATFNSTAGNAVTLSTAVTGGITATRSSATLTGGSSSLASSATVTIGGTTALGLQVQITIGGTAVTHTLTSADTTGTVAAMLAAHINANPVLKTFVWASWVVGNPNVVTIKSKYGFLNFSEPLINAHSNASGGEEVIRVMASFTKENILDGTFKWPGGNEQSSVNQVKIIYREAKDGFAERELHVNDYDHQKQVRKVNPKEVDGSAIDSFHQAARIGNWYLAKLRDGDFYVSFSASAGAMLLEEGDVVCCTDASGGFVNLPIRIEQLSIGAGPKYDVAIKARIYSTNMYSDTVVQKTVPLPSTLKYLSATPPVATSLILTEEGSYSSDGIWHIRIKGTFNFGSYVGRQDALVKITRPNGTIERQVVEPDNLNTGAFTFNASISGLYTVLVTTRSLPYKLSAASGHPTDTKTPTGNPNIPPASASGTVTNTGNTLVYKWAKVTDTDLLAYRVTNPLSANAVVQEALSLEYRFVPATGVTPITRRVYSLNRAGHSSDELVSGKYLELSFDVPALQTPSQLPAPGSFVITFDGVQLVHKYNAVTHATFGGSYKIATADDGTGVIQTLTGRVWNDSQLTTDPRSGTRYVCAVDFWGNNGLFAGYSYNVTSPAAPTITLGTAVPNAQTFKVKSNEAAAKRITFSMVTVQIATDSGFTNIVGEKTGAKPYPSDTVVVTVNKPTTVRSFYARAWFSDAFGAGATTIY